MSRSSLFLRHCAYIRMARPAPEGEEALFHIVGADVDGEHVGAVQGGGEDARLVVHAPAQVAPGTVEREVLLPAHQVFLVIQFNSILYSISHGAIQFFTVYQVIYVINNLYRESCCFHLYYS